MQDLENLLKKIKEIKKQIEEKIPYPYERREFKIYLLRETGIDETEIQQEDKLNKILNKSFVFEVFPAIAYLKKNNNELTLDNIIKELEENNYKNSNEFFNKTAVELAQQYKGFPDDYIFLNYNPNRQSKFLLPNIELRAENYKDKDWSIMSEILGYNGCVGGLFINDKNFIVGPKGIGKTHNVLTRLRDLLAYFYSLENRNGNFETIDFKINIDNKNYGYLYDEDHNGILHSKRNFIMIYKIIDITYEELEKYKPSIHEELKGSKYFALHVGDGVWLNLLYDIKNKKFGVPIRDITYGKYSDKSWHEIASGLEDYLIKDIDYFKSENNRRVLYLQYNTKNSQFEFYDTTKLEYWRSEEEKGPYHLCKKVDKNLSFLENLEKIISSETGGILILDDIHYLLDDLEDKKISPNEVYKIISSVNKFKGRKLFISEDILNSGHLKLKWMKKNYPDLYAIFPKVNDKLSQEEILELCKGKDAKTIKEIINNRSYSKEERVILMGFGKFLPFFFPKEIYKEEAWNQIYLRRCLLENLKLTPRDFIIIKKEMDKFGIPFDKQGICYFTLMQLYKIKNSEKYNIISKSEISEFEDLLEKETKEEDFTVDPDFWRKNLNNVLYNFCSENKDSYF